MKTFVDQNRALNFGEFKDGKLQQPIPPALEPHENDIKHFTELCNKTAARVMRLLALGLEVHTTTWPDIRRE
jgi:isopenicillin N synthase-like dioxygenase